MAGGFKKYSVDHEALFNDVRSNRYAKDRAPEPAKSETPPAQEQPKQPPAVTEAAPVHEQQAKKPAIDTPSPATAPTQRKTNPKPKEKPETGDTVQVRVRVRFPASGVSAKYDAMAEQLGEDEAFRAVFRAAFENYRNRLDEGKMPVGPKTYPAGKETYRSNKVMTASQFRVVDEALNPVGLVAPSTLGRMVAERALALFFHEENKTA